MPKRQRTKTKYPGVYAVDLDGEKAFYIAYRRKGEARLIEERAVVPGKAMTAALANQLRSERIRGKAPTNKERREAREAERKAAGDRVTITKLWNLYRENLEGLKSQAADTSRFNLYIAPSFGDKEPHDLMPLDIDRLKRRTLAGKSDQTVKHVLALLRRLVRYGVEKKISAPLAFNLDMPHVDNQVTETLEGESLKRLLDVLDHSEDIQVSHLMKLALYTGMRRGELVKLLWTDIDYKNGDILLRSPKGKKSMTIPLNDEARKLLKAHPKIADHVFVNEKKKPLREFRKRVDAIRKEAKLPAGFRPLHGLRHVYATLLASSGKVDIYTLQRLLTHKSTSTTQRYAHIMDKALKQASSVIVDAIGEATKE